MFQQDSITQPIIVKDSIFIPIYLKKNPLDRSQDNVSNISCKQYIEDILNESFPLPQQRESMFVERDLYANRDLKMQARQDGSQQPWVFAVFGLVIFVLALLFKFGRRQYGEFIAGCFSSNTLNLSTKNGERIQHLSLFGILFSFIPMLSMLVYAAMNYFDMLSILDPLKNYIHSYFLMIIILIALAYFIKIIFIRFFGWVFRSKSIANFYVQLHYNFNFLLSLTLFLPVFALFYTDSFYQEELIFASVFLLVLEWFTRIIKTFMVNIKSIKFSHLYLFFYLCTIELIPIIVLIKLLLQ